VSAQAPPTPDARRGSRALGPGSRRTFAIALASVAILVVAGVVLYLTRSGSSAPRSLFAPSPSTAAEKYGGLPSWLPKPKVGVGRIVHASAQHPWLAIEGDTVDVALASGTVQATVVGPAVPEEGTFPVPRTTPCSFTVTFTAASGAVPLSARAFTIVDELGALHHPRVSGALPSRVLPGRRVSIALSAVLPTGAGTLRWSPTAGRPVVSWDFDVEID